MSNMSLEEDSVTLRSASSPVKPLRFLLIEDCGIDAHLVQTHLKSGLNAPLLVEHVENVSHATRLLGAERFDLVLLDLTLPDSAGLATFRTIFEHAEGDAILILSNRDDRELAVEAVRGGAQDYILKGELGAQTLGLAVQFAMERNKRIKAECELDKTRAQIRLARRLQKGLYPPAAPVIKAVFLSKSVMKPSLNCPHL